MAAALLIFRLRRSDHITDALISLHWLRVPERIVFKVAVQTYRALHGDAPQYLRQLLQPRPERINKRRSRLFERVSWGNMSPITYMTLLYCHSNHNFETIITVSSHYVECPVSHIVPSFVAGTRIGSALGRAKTPPLGLTRPLPDKFFGILGGALR